ncbi:LPXTG cell wall anchor domain-containing protein [Listeria welshimeri]|nr:LPXTG cell wall anchor domain-containing protein [Listeria welshimeri]MBC1431933.1 LPXTG cell wall anchor domain-containing protein [Listeria welshimeri]MBC2334048.1 LPXTG cell wall anchor domain-containing protein [Listeria welshimeri]
MKNLKKGLVATLAIGLALSISAPVFATENTESEEVKDSTVESSTAVEKEQTNVVEKETIKDEKATEPSETIKKPLKAAPNAVTAKTGLSFEIGAKPAATDFVTINDDTNKPTFTFKNGAPTTATAGNYSTVILVTFDDATSVEVTADYTVKAATPLATLKTTPVIAQGSKPTPSQFATPAAGVQLSFKTGVPSTTTPGYFSTTIVATKDGKTEELVAPFYVIDQTPPEVSLIDEDSVFTKGEVLTPEDFVIATDNAGKVKLSFKPGYEASTSTTGYHETVIIAKDTAGNTQEVTVSYFVINNVATLKTPVLDEKNSTAKVIYGKTSSNVTVEMLSENGDLIATTTSDSSGNFTLKLKTPLKQNDFFVLFAFDDNGNYSDYGGYSYIGQDMEIVETPTVTAKKPDIKTIVKNSNKNNVKVKDPKKSEGTLPKTGDESSLPLTAIGLLLASGTVIVLRKKQA